VSELIEFAGIGIRFIVEGSESNETQAIFETTVGADAKVPAPHSHDAYEATIIASGRSAVSVIEAWTPGR